MLKAGSIPVPPDPSPSTDLLVISPCNPKDTEVNAPSAVAQNLRDSDPVGSLPLTQSLI